MAGLGQGIESAAPSIENTMTGLSDRLASTFSSVILGAQNAGEAIKNLALQLADSAIQNAFGMLFQSFGGGGGLAGARAMGGPVIGGSAYLVGERGPEIFVPSRSGNIVPNHNMPDGDGVSMKTEVHVHGAPSEPRVEHSPGRVDIIFDKAVANALTRGPARGVLRDAYGVRGRGRGR